MLFRHEGLQSQINYFLDFSQFSTSETSRVNRYYIDISPQKNAVVLHHV